ncbi:MAG: hypothetical protein WC829_03285 [Hyphomicrobium sp.]|jgi:hypothetical protein
MTTYTLLQAAKLIDTLTQDIADLLPTAADDADIDIVLDTKRTGSTETMLAEALTLRLVHNGWTFTHTNPNQPEPEPTTDTTTTSTTALAAEVQVRHELRPEDGTGDPVCLCGFKPVPPEVKTQGEAVAMINRHVVDENRKRAAQ